MAAGVVSSTSPTPPAETASLFPHVGRMVVQAEMEALKINSRLLWNSRPSADANTAAAPFSTAELKRALGEHNGNAPDKTPTSRFAPRQFKLAHSDTQLFHLET